MSCMSELIKCLFPVCEARRLYIAHESTYRLLSTYSLTTVSFRLRFFHRKILFVREKNKFCLIPEGK